jgi:hypothetical protein
MTAELTLADAIVTAINAGSYSQTVSATRVPFNEVDLVQISSGLIVNVIPMASTQTPATLSGSTMDEFQVDIEIRGPINSTNAVITASDTDALSTIAQQIVDNAIAAPGNTAVFVRADKSNVVDQEKLREQRIFGNGVTLVFQLIN